VAKFEVVFWKDGTEPRKIAIMVADTPKGRRKHKRRDDELNYLKKVQAKNWTYLVRDVKTWYKLVRKTKTLKGLYCKQQQQQKKKEEEEKEEGVADTCSRFTPENF
jgi:hypothetical protein